MLGVVIGATVILVGFAVVLVIGNHITSKSIKYFKENY